MTPYTQKARQFRLTTPLGPDVLLCARWSCVEAVSSLFELRIVALSEKRDISPKDLLLKTVSLHCVPKEGAERYFTGIVRHVERSLDKGGPLVEYVLHVVPPAWLLTQGAGYHVYQDKDVVAILRDTLGPLTVDWQLQGAFPPVPSRTRFRESRWDFATRLLEREGAWYTFKHSASACTLLLANSSAAAAPQHGLTQLRDTSWDGNAQLLDITTSQQPYVKKTVVGSSNAALFGRDNREETTAPQLPPAPTGFALDPGAFPATMEHQLYEFIAGQDRDGADKGGGDTPAELSKLVEDLRGQAKLRAQGDAATGTRVHGASTATGLMAGAKVGIDSVGDPSTNGQYFVTSVQHYGENGSYIAGDNTEPSYSNAFTAIPFDVVYRPPRWTPWPSVQGMHVATVIGPAGEEIFTDKLGRIRVAFEWNRDASTPNGPGDTCWVRVAQMVAGPGWGTFFLPRVGHQVLVSFLGGDPDAPVVVGSLYNDVNMPQIKLPDDKTQSAMRTRSSPQGSAETYNELRFEDKKGAEHVTFQAERDFIGVIKHDSTLTVKEGNQSVTLEQGDQSLTISQGKYSIDVKGDVTTDVQSGNMTTTVKSGDATTKISAGKSSHEAAQDITIESTGGKVTITSPMQIELTVGGSSIKLTPTGVEIAGTMFKASANATAEVSGSAMLTLKGGVVMIN